MKRRSFDSGGREDLHRAVRGAEERIGSFYCIPGREWPRYPYEVKSLEEDPGPEGSVFADLVRLVPLPGRGRRTPVSELYRIRLRDDTILSAVHERSDGIELFPLLLYVITHELVHVVRFRGGAAAFDAPAEERRREEARVHAITREVLRPVDDPSLARVLGAYRPATSTPC